ARRSLYQTARSLAGKFAVPGSLSPTVTSMKMMTEPGLAGVDWKVGIPALTANSHALDKQRVDWRSWCELSTWLPSVAILFVGMGLVSWLYLTPAYVPDEVWFRGLAAKTTAELAEKGLWKLIWTQENQLGYGSVYWIVYALLGHWFSDP